MSFYAGAGSRLAPDRGLSLSPDRWAWQPKIDGVYVRVSTDRAGRISRLLTRAGRDVRQADADGLVGLPTGLPDSVLAGELEASTEAGLRAREARGWPALHVFDVLRWLGRSVTERPYADRYQRLQIWQDCVEADREVPREDWWTPDDQGDAHDPSTGRYVRPVPRDLRRLPLVELARGARAGRDLWDRYVGRGGGEGLVAVRLDAPLGARGSKRKIKAGETIDAVVVQADHSGARLVWRGHSFLVGARGLEVGEVVEVACDGFYETSVTPRFARVIRRRTDLH